MFVEDTNNVGLTKFICFRFVAGDGLVFFFSAKIIPGSIYRHIHLAWDMDDRKISNNTVAALTVHYCNFS